MSGEDRPGPPDEGGTGSDPGDERAGRIAVIGRGRVGLSLAAALSDAGRSVTVFGRRPGRPGFLEGHPDVRYRSDVPAPHSSAVDGASPRRRDAPSTLVFCVPDDALSDAASDWARALALDAPRTASGEEPPGRAAGPAGDRGGETAGVALHTSGVHGADVLASLREAGRAVAAWHPLTALAAPRADAFRGVTFTVEGDGAAARRARVLSEAVGGRAKGLEPSEHARYHAAAVFASNHLVACLSVAARELAAATGGEGSLDDLLPLARAAVENLSGTELAEGATGPIPRGDVGTVRRHLRALEPESAELYRRLARELLDVVEGRLEDDAAGELRRILADPTGEGS